jgi:hypothetical protein
MLCIMDCTNPIFNLDVKKELDLISETIHILLFITTDIWLQHNPAYSGCHLFCSALSCRFHRVANSACFCIGKIRSPMIRHVLKYQKNHKELRFHSYVPPYLKTKQKEHKKLRFGFGISQIIVFFWMNQWT